MIQQKITGTVYGVILNDVVSRQKIGPLDAAPYKGAPQAPVLYLKPANTFAPSASTVILPEGAASVEIGATLGLVIGRDASRLSPGEALAAVSGLVLAADLSLPHASYYRPAIREKCFDGALPLARPQPFEPSFDFSSLVLTIEIDGQLVERRSLVDLIRKPAQLLADVTEFMTLRQGDVLLVGVAYQAPQASTGQRVRLSAESLGCLEFSLAAPGGKA